MSTAWTAFDLDRIGDATELQVTSLRADGSLRRFVTIWVVRVVDVPDPVVQQPTDALVRVVRACICGSDLHPYHSMRATPEGISMGHEFVGVVEDVGRDVATVRRGDLVIAPFAWSDGTCDF